MKKIAFVSDHASPLSAAGGVDSGGQNVYVAQVATHLAQLGCKVDVFTRRDREALPFRSRLAGHGDKVRMAFSRGPDGRRLDIPAIVDAAPADAELYCCGPRGMLDAFLAQGSDAATGREA